MDKNNQKPQVCDSVIIGENERLALDTISGGDWKKYTRVAMAALSGIPWVGSVLSATATLSSENEQSKTNSIIILWVQEHEQKMKELGETLNDIFKRFNSFGEEIKARLESVEYLNLVRKTFSLWDKAETAEKKEMFKKLIINSGVINLTQNDLVRLFLEWIEKYHELHFLVIGEIYKNPMITRKQIWENIRGEIPRDNSFDAHLFKLLISDLSLGEVIQQYKESNDFGNYMKSNSAKRNKTNIRQSSFEDTKPYVLTELGKSFVHYVMEDVVLQVNKGAENSYEG